MSISKLPEDCLVDIFSSLSDQDIAGAARTNRDFLARKQARDASIFFKLNIGALLPSEDLKTFNYGVEIDRSRKWQDLGKLVKAPLLESFWDKLSYYTGVDQAQLCGGLIKSAEERAAQADAMLQKTAPTTLIEHRDNVFRVNTFYKEIKGMLAGLDASKKILDEETAKLNCILYVACTIAQVVVTIFSAIFLGIKRAALEAVELEFWRNEGKLYHITGGAYSATPQTERGVRIGETQITLGGAPQTIGVYAYPSYYTFDGISFSGKMVFNLSRNGQDSLGRILIERVWSPQGGGLSFTEAAAFRPGDEKQKLLRGSRKLEIDYSGSFQCPNDERPARPLMCALTQLAVEILHRENEQLLVYSNNYDHAYVLFAGGFQASSDYTFKEKRIRAETAAARAEGNAFPAYKDAQSFPLLLLNTAENPVLDRTFDFSGAGPMTWREQIRERPMLAGEGPILPRYMERNLFLQEVDGGSLPELRPRRHPMMDDDDE